YPLPENLGFDLDVNRGNVIQHVKGGSSAARAGLKADDIVRRLNAVPIHSFADVQFALDIAPKEGFVEIVWQRGEKLQSGKLALPQGWRKTDISWRPSMREFLPNTGLSGRDLPAEEKKAFGLSVKQLAFRQNDAVPPQALAAGIRGGDIILG